jgi:hypothetical protein
MPIIAGILESLALLGELESTVLDLELFCLFALCKEKSNHHS